MAAVSCYCRQRLFGDYIYIHKLLAIIHFVKIVAEQDFMFSINLFYQHFAVRNNMTSQKFKYNFTFLRTSTLGLHVYLVVPL